MRQSAQRMRTWVKWTIVSVVTVVVGFSVLAGTGSYYFFRHLTTAKASETDTLKEFDTIRARFGTRPPLVEIVNLQAADIRINRTAHPEGRRATTLHVFTWSEDGTRLQSDVPLWLMRFSSLNILSKLGVAPERFRLTVDDIERYGPGLVVDFRQPGKNSAIVWVD